MDDVARPQRLTLPLPLTGAAVSGGAVMLGFLLVPDWRLEHWVSASGIPAILAAAEPPLGFTARIALGLVFGGMTAAFAWFGLKQVAGDRPLVLPQWKVEFDMAKWSALLRRPAKPADGAPRPPLFANRELGTAFMDVKAPARHEELGPPPEQDLPLDLDQPLAAFDPAAVPVAPLPVPEPVAPLAQVPPRPQLIDPGDRFETFELTPMQRVDTPSLRVEPDEPAPVPTATSQAVVAPETESTVHALLERLERGLGQAAAVPAAPVAEPEPVAPPLPVAEAPAAEPEPEPAAPAIRPGSLQDTLGDLRRLAMGGQ